jgi:hypothetical protein
MNNHCSIDLLCKLGKSREAELRRINKELTNIRQRFRGLNLNIKKRKNSS